MKRSDRVFDALHTLRNRYMLCQLASKATRKFHKPNTRIQETMNEVQNRLPFRACNLIQNFVHGFLDSGIRLMKLTGSLGGKLTEHITVPQSM